MRRVTVYIDGLKRMAARKQDWQKLFWIDFVALFKHFAPYHDVHKVKYFTSKPNNVRKIIRQALLIKANRLLHGNRFEVIYGKYYDKEFTCPSCNYQYVIPEEKRTDVNISVEMMRDCRADSADILFLVSADSDLIPPLKAIKEDFPDKKITVFFPPDNFSYDIRNFVKDSNYHLVRLENNKGKFIASIMPDVVTANGKTYTIPPEWKII